MWTKENCGKLSEEVRVWCEENRIHPLVRPLFSKLGITTVEQVHKFLYSNLSDASSSTAFGEQIYKAVKRINRAVNSGEHIVLFGDYDVDGTTGTALLMTVFEYFKKAKGFTVDYIVPDRFSEGYGLNDKSMLRLLQMNPNLVITIDCGIKSVSQIEKLKSMGIDVIVTDHHHPGDKLPEAAVAIVHPEVCNFPNKKLCGCGVAYQLARAIWQTKGLPVPEWVEYGLLDFVALGTICDMMPLVGDNRIYVREGLKILNTRQRTAIAVMKNKLGWNKIDRGIIGFQIGPCINANGRLEKADTAVKFLLSRDVKECTRLVDIIAERNQKRKELQAHVVEKGLLQIPHQRYKNIIVIMGDDFHEGVVGIAASKFVNKYRKPTFILHDGGAHVGGSARSLPGIDLYSSMKKFEHLLHTWGGHSAAAGLKLQKSDMDEFFRSVDEDLDRYARDVWEAGFTYFGEITEEGMLTEDFFRSLELFEPFGYGFPAPIWKMSGCIVDEKHLKKDAKVGKIEVSGNKYNFAMWENAEKSFWYQDQVYYGTWERHPKYGPQFTAIDAEPPKRQKICIHF